MGLIIDCFAGGGGASVGIEMALGRPVDIAVNHDPEAIRMHKVNHPDTLHLTEDIFKADLKGIVKGRKVSLMWASPDCTSHSKAKGGQPRLSGLRILPWAVFKHAREILPEVIIMENVEEIQQWGPLDEKGYIIPERKGRTTNDLSQPCAPWGIGLTAGSWWQQITAHPPPGNAGMRFSGETKRKLYGQRKPEQKITGSHAENILTGQTLASQYLAGRSRWQQPHRNGLQMGSGNTSWRANRILCRMTEQSLSSSSTTESKRPENPEASSCRSR